MRQVCVWDREIDRRGRPLGKMTPSGDVSAARGRIAERRASGPLATCVECGRNFRRLNRLHVYCSGTCRNRARKRRKAEARCARSRAAWAPFTNRLGLLDAGEVARRLGVG